MSSIREKLITLTDAIIDITRPNVKLVCKDYTYSNACSVFPFSKDELLKIVLFRALNTYLKTTKPQVKNRILELLSIIYNELDLDKTLHLKISVCMDSFIKMHNSNLTMDNLCTFIPITHNGEILCTYINFGYSLKKFKELPRHEYLRIYAIKTLITKIVDEIEKQEITADKIREMYKTYLDYYNSMPCTPINNFNIPKIVEIHKESIRQAFKSSKNTMLFADYVDKDIAEGVVIEYDKVNELGWCAEDLQVISVSNSSLTIIPILSIDLRTPTGQHITMYIVPKKYYAKLMDDIPINARIIL